MTNVILIGWAVFVLAGVIGLNRELLVNGIYRDGFFNFRILWLLMLWAGCGIALAILLHTRALR